MTQSRLPFGKGWIVLLIWLLWLPETLQGQRRDGELEISGRIEQSYEPVGNGTIRIYEGSRMIRSVTTNSRGRFSFTLPLEGEYIVAFSAPGLVTKRLMFDTSIKDRRTRDRLFQFDFVVDLFPEIDGIDFTFFEEPLSTIAFIDEINRFFFRESETSPRLRRANEIHRQVVDLIRRREAYAQTIVQADQFFRNQSYDQARASYVEANGFLPDETYPVRRIEEIDRILAEQRDQRAQDLARQQEAQREREREQQAEQERQRLQREQQAAANRQQEAERLRQEQERQAELARQQEAERQRQAEQARQQEAERQRLERERQAELARQQEAERLRQEQEHQAELARQQEAERQRQAEQARQQEAERQRLAEQERQRLERERQAELARQQEAERLRQEQERQAELARQQEAERQRQAEQARQQEAERQRLAEQERQRVERERQAELARQQEAERLRQEQERQAELARQQEAERQRLAEQERLRVERERQAELARQQEAERLRQEQERQAELARQQEAERQRQAEQARQQEAERQRLAEQERQRLERERQAELARQQEAERLRQEQERMAELARQQEAERQRQAEQARQQEAERHRQAELARQQEAERQRQAELARQQEAERQRQAALAQQQTQQRPQTPQPSASSADNQREYNAAIAQGDQLFQRRQFFNARDAYQLALSFRPNESHPSHRIREINQILADSEEMARFYANGFFDVSNVKERILNNSEKRYYFVPFDRRRTGSYLMLQAENLDGRPMRLFINYGKDNERLGGFSINIGGQTGVTDLKIDISGQARWITDDNNWISIYPLGGNIELHNLKIHFGPGQ